MNELLRLLADYYGFIWGESRYRIVDSGSTESFGDAFVVMASDDLRIRVARDRSQFLWDFQAPGSDARDWYDVDVVWRLLTEEDVASVTEPDDRVAAFIREHLAVIEGLFAAERIGATKDTLNSLQRLRAKELFG